jgi:hypothetical protein
MPDIKPRVRPMVAGEDRWIHADTHLSRDRCQNGSNGILDISMKETLSMEVFGVFFVFRDVIGLKKKLMSFIPSITYSAINRGFFVK